MSQFAINLANLLRGENVSVGYTEAEIDDIIGGPSEPAAVPPQIVSAEIGDTANDILVVVFDSEIKIPFGSELLGVNVFYNGLGQTVAAATRQPDRVTMYYSIAVAVEPEDVVTFTYEASDGFIQNAEGVHLEDASEFPVVNNNAGGGGG